MGIRGDDIAQMDWTTGEIMKTLDKLKLTKNTLVIFTSDNGPILNDGYDDKSEQDVGNHKPAGPFRGGKYSAYEAGTRVPTIVHWPASVKPGVSSALISQVDFFASLATLTRSKLHPADAPDSFDMLAALTGKSMTGRKTMLEEAFTLAVRNGHLKYIAPQAKSTPAWLKDKMVETGLSFQPQLFNLKNDVNEQHNIVNEHREEADKMQKMIDAIKEDGTRPGYKKTI
jgi:arylsulfatase A-like enzyme